jgi:hypothetical protein
MVHVVSSLRPITNTSPVAVHKPVRPTTTATTTTAATDTSTDTGAADFRALFTPKISSAGVTAGPNPFNPPANPAPTAESVFGSNPWVTNPTGVGPNGQTYGYNPFYFASPDTAAKVAQMVGGTVVQSNQFTGNGGAFTQQQPNLMVQMPDGGLINPGLVASFYTHGYPQSYVDQLVSNEAKNT